MHDLIQVYWCSFCCERESAGILKVIDPDNGEVELEACLPCYEEIANA